MVRKKKKKSLELNNCDPLMKTKTWALVPLPPGNNLVGWKWIYKTKLTAEG